MIRAIAIKTLPDFKLEVKFNDGVQGVFDLSPLKNGEAFKCWLEKGNFEKAYIDGEGIAWNDDLDIDALSVYLEITGQTFEEFADKQKKLKFSSGAITEEELEDEALARWINEGLKSEDVPIEKVFQLLEKHGTKGKSNR